MIASPRQKNKVNKYAAGCLTVRDDDREFVPNGRFGGQLLNVGARAHQKLRTNVLVSEKPVEEAISFKSNA